MADTSTANRLAGLCYLTIDGQSYMLEGAAKYSVAPVKRETLGGQDHIHGFKEMPLAPFMSFTMRNAQGLSVAQLNSLTNSTVVFQLANGKMVVGANMWTVDAQEVDTEDGKIEVKFEGVDGSVTEQ